MSYPYIINLNSNRVKNSSILLIGSGYMANQYSDALFKMGIHDVTIIGNSKNKVRKICKKFGYTPLYGGFEKNLPNVNSKDLTIVATPIPLLVSATKLALSYGQKNILIEKPG